MSTSVVPEELTISVLENEFVLGVFSPLFKEGDARRGTPQARAVLMYNYTRANLDRSILEAVSVDSHKRPALESREPFTTPVPTERHLINKLMMDDPLGVHAFVNPCADVYGAYSASLIKIAKKLNTNLYDWMKASTHYMATLYSKSDLNDPNLVFPSINLRISQSSTHDTELVRKDPRWFSEQGRPKNRDEWAGRIIPIHILPFVLAESNYSGWNLILLKVARIMQARISSPSVDILQRYFYEQTIFNARKVLQDRATVAKEIMHIAKQTIDNHRTGDSIGNTLRAEEEVPNSGELFMAAAEGDIVAVRRCIVDVGDVNLPHPRTRQTPLFISSLNGHEEVVELLLQCGAAIPDPEDLTPKQSALISTEHIFFFPR
jgi:hypothetical protein